MTTEMTQRPESQLAPYGEGNGFTGQFDQDDLAVPIVTLVQPITKEKGDAQVGEFLFPDGRHFNTLDAVTLGVAATRSLMGNIDLDEGVICSSNDRRIGNTDNPLKVLGEEEFAARGIENASTMLPCEGCTHYDDDQYSNADYLCKKGYMLTLYEVEHQFPFLYRVRGAAMKEIVNKLVGPMLLHAQKTGKPEPWRFIYHWEGREVKSKFLYWTPTLYIDPETGHLDEEQQDRYRSLAESYTGRTQQSVDENAAPSNGDPIKVPGPQEPMPDAPPM